MLLEVRAAGMCHSDVHIWEGYYDLGGGNQIKMEGRVPIPRTLGP